PGQRGAHTFPREVVDRAPEFEIDKIRTARFDQRGGPREFAWICPRELYAEARFLGRSPDQRELTLTLLFETPREGHLADGHARSQLDTQTAVGQIRALRHRTHHDG